MHELPARPARATRAITVDAVPFAADPSELLDVDVDQLARHRTFVAIPVVGRRPHVRRLPLGERAGVLLGAAIGASVAVAHLAPGVVAGECPENLVARERVTGLK
jgi:hypothetical protein